MIAALLLSLGTLTVTQTPTAAAYTEFPTPSGTVVYGVLDFDHTWTTANSPYLVEGYVTVAPGVRLTVEAGVVIRMNRTSPSGWDRGDLYIEGELVAQGTPAAHVIFTTNATIPTYSSWRNIWVNATGRVDLNWAELWYGHVTPLIGSGSTGSVLRNSTIAWAGNGTLVQGISNRFESVEWAYSPVSGYATHFQGVNNSIENSTIHDYRRGIQGLGSGTVAINNTFYNMTEVDMAIANGLTGVRVYHNSFLSNVSRHVEIYDGATAFDNGYPDGGNFWSDYIGVDNCSGPAQSVCPDPDGIGDTPYVLLHEITGLPADQDNYPLMCIPSGCDQPPQIQGITANPDPQELGLQTTLTATVTDDGLVSGVWANVTGPGGPVGNFTLGPGLPGEYTDARPYAVVGGYAFTVWAVDDVGQWASASGTYAVVDTTPPSITNVVATPDPQGIGGIVNLTASVTDLSAIGNVTAAITDPTGTTAYDAMGWVAGTVYGAERTYNVLGIYTVNVTAMDIEDNAATAPPVTFTIVDLTPPSVTDLRADPPSQTPGGFVNVSANVTDDLPLIAVDLTVTPPSGPPIGPIPMVQDGDRWFVNRTYTILGVHDVLVRARDEAMNLATATGSFEIVDPNAPVADAGPDQMVENGTLVAFDGSASSDNVGIVNYTWDFTYNGSSVRLYDLAPTFRFDRLGTYPVALTVLDGSGQNDTDTVLVIVQDTTPPPAPIASVAPQARGELNVTWTASAVPDVATYRVEREGPVGTWTLRGSVPGLDFLDTGLGDGDTRCYRVLAVDQSGNAGLPSLTACGTTIDDTTPPVAVAGADRTVVNGTVVAFDGSASSDASGIVNHTWTGNDGTAFTLFGPTPSRTFANPGVFVVTLTVSDAYGNVGQDNLTVTVRPPNAPPAILAVEQVPDPVERLASVTLRAQVVDADLAGVWIAVTDALGITANLTLVAAGMDWYESPYPTALHGDHALVVSALDADGQWTVALATLHVVDTTPPGPPSDLQTSVRDATVYLSWSPSSSDDVDRYEVWRDGGSGMERRATVPDITAFYDTEVEEGRTYGYAVRALDRAGNPSVFTDEASATLPAFPWWLVILAVAVTAGLVAFLVWRRRRKRPEADVPPKELDGGKPDDTPGESSK